MRVFLRMIQEGVNQKRAGPSSLTRSLSHLCSGHSLVMWSSCAYSYGSLSSLLCREISQESFTSSPGDLTKDQQLGSFCASVCSLPVFAFVSHHA